MPLPKPENIAEILTSSEWNAGTQFYDFLHRIEFRPDSTGHMMTGGGQLLSLAADFRYRVLPELAILFEYLDTYGRYGQTFRRTPENAAQTVNFKLINDPLVVEEPFIGPQTYLYTLRFASSPFPIDTSRYYPGNLYFLDDTSPQEKLLFFYGYKQEQGGITPQVDRNPVKQLQKTIGGFFGFGRN